VVLERVCGGVPETQGCCLPIVACREGGAQDGGVVDLSHRLPEGCGKRVWVVAHPRRPARGKWVQRAGGYFQRWGVPKMIGVVACLSSTC